MCNSEPPSSYEDMKARLAAAESALRAIREGRADAVAGEGDALLARSAEAEARQAHLKRVLLAIRNVNQLIVAENDPWRLIERACVNLTETMGYHNAWIALLGGEAARGLGLETEGPVAAASAGFDGGFETLRERLDRGDFPVCMARALASENALVTDNPTADCPDCPLSGQYAGRAGLARRLEFDGVTWGILTASVPAAYAHDAEEQDLFNEVAADIAFALHKIAATRTLEESRRHMALVIKGAGVGTWEWNAQTNETRFNEQWAAMLGFTIEELMPCDYTTWERLVHPEDLERARQALTDCLEGRTADYNCEFRMQHRDGRWVWILDRGRVMAHDDVGKALTMFGTHTDITEIKQTENALRTERELSRRLIEGGPVGILKVNRDGEVVFANRHAEQLFGLRMSNIEGRKYNTADWRITTVDGLPFPDEELPFRRVMATGGGVTDIQHAIVRADGARRILSINGAPLHDAQGQIEGVVFAILDITERKAVEENLRTALNQQEAIFNASMVGVMLLHNRVITRVNRRLAEMLGYTPDEMEGRGPQQLHLSHEHFVEFGEKYYWRLAEEKIVQIEYPLRHKDGRTVWCLFHGSALEPPDMARGAVWIIDDITERKKAEEALRESEGRVRAKLNALLEPEGDFGTLKLADVVDCDEVQSLMNDFHAVTDIPIGIIDLDGNILVGTGWQDVCTKFHRAHPETEKLCRESDLELTSGVEPGTFKAYKCKNNMWDIVTPIMVGDEHMGNLFLGQFFFEDEAPDIATFREQARRYGFDEEAYLKAYRSIPRWSRQTVDRVMTFYCNLINVISRLSYTHIKLARATEALRKSESLFQTMLAAIPDMISIHDAEMNVVYSNWNGFAAVPPDRRTLGEKCYRIYRGHDKVCPDCRARQVIETREPYAEEVELPEGGWYELNVIPILDPNGNCDLFVEWVSDITGRKQVEETLRESESRFRGIFEHAPTGIALVDLDYRLQASNQAYRDLLGREESEIQVLSLKDFTHPDDLEENLRLQSRLGRGEIDEYSMVKRFIRKNGDVRWGHLTACLIRDSNGAPLGFLGHVLDITQLRQAEEERERLDAQLQQAQKMEAVGRLAGGVAHDFNNMLNVILGHAEIMSDDLPDDSPLREDLDDICSAAERSANLTRQLLAFARKQTVAPKDLDLNETVASMLKMLQRLIGEDIDLLWKPGAPLDTVHIDPGQVDQMLANLAVNARDAIGHAHGKITIETSNARFDEAYCADHTGYAPGDYVMLGVSDDGCGMDEETRANIFEPFFTTKGVGEGTGLGLATVYGIARQNEGFVNVYSEPGQGTTFRIYLPALVETSARPAIAEDGPDSTDNGDETILLVEDQPALRNLAQTMLQRLGYTVLTAGTPGEALRRAREQSGRIDLLITDVVMPEMNGRELAEHLQALRPGLKSLFMSGYTANVIAHQGVLEEGVNFMQKPFSQKDLARKARQALDA